MIAIKSISELHSYRSHFDV